MSERLRRLFDWALLSPLLLVGWLFSRMSPNAALRRGAAVGRFWQRSGLARVATARRNLEIAFPGWSEAERERTLVAHFEHLGRTLAELALLHGPHRASLLDEVEMVGKEYFDDLLEAERRAGRSGGMIALTAHFGTWELGGMALARRGFPLVAVHHDIPNTAAREIIMGWRESTGMETLELGRSGLGVLRALINGAIVALLADQNAPRDEAVFAPFFGEIASTRDGPARIAMFRNVPMLPVFFYRKSIDPPRYVVQALPPVEIEPPGDDPSAALERNVVRMNQALEEGIRLAPEQWLWVHGRWKTRPEGAPKLYGRRRRRA